MLCAFPRQGSTATDRVTGLNILARPFSTTIATGSPIEYKFNFFFFYTNVD